jgi:hypothetical protein
MGTRILRMLRSTDSNRYSSVLRSIRKIRVPVFHIRLTKHGQTSRILHVPAKPT